MPICDNDLLSQGVLIHDNEIISLYQMCEAIGGHDRETQLRLLEYVAKKYTGTGLIANQRC